MNGIQVVVIESRDFSNRFELISRREHQLLGDPFVKCFSKSPEHALEDLRLGEPSVEVPLYRLDRESDPPKHLVCSAIYGPSKIHKVDHFLMRSKLPGMHENPHSQTPLLGI